MFGAILVGLSPCLGKWSTSGYTIGSSFLWDVAPSQLGRKTLRENRNGLISGIELPTSLSILRGRLNSCLLTLDPVMRRYMPEERRPQLHHFESQESRTLHVSFQAITANVVSKLYDTVQGVSLAYGRNFSWCFVICVCVFVFFFWC